MAVTDLLLSNLALAFVTGLISSFGHCLGMCGGIVAIFSARQMPRSSASSEAALAAPAPSILARIGSFLPLHIGRITTYAVLGLVIGLAGSLLDKAGGLLGWQGAFSVLVGLAMIAVSLSLMGVLPPMEMALGAITGGNSPLKRMRGLFAQQNLLSRLAVGLLWGMLPCGLVFAMLVVASRTGTPWGGALTMLAFGLGTVPTLLGFGLAANLLSPRLRGRLQIVAALLILLFAVQTILRGLAVAGLINSLIIGPVMLW
jgi:uncharacterized protein